MSADAAKAAFEVIRDRMADGGAVEKGTAVVIATVKGDIHDIGKNIVKVLLENYGYNVIDLGKDVAVEAIVKAVLEHKAHVVGLSALMTTTVGAMAATIKALRDVCNCRIVVGGAVLTQDYADSIGADHYAPNAVSAVGYVNEVVEKDEHGNEVVGQLQERLLRADIQKNMQSILYTKTRGEKISDVTVHERRTCRVFVFGKVLFARTKQ